MFGNKKTLAEAQAALLTLQAQLAHAGINELGPEEHAIADAIKAQAEASTESDRVLIAGLCQLAGVEQAAALHDALQSRIQGLEASVASAQQEAAAAKASAEALKAEASTMKAALVSAKLYKSEAEVPANAEAIAQAIADRTSNRAAEQLAQHGIQTKDLPEGNLSADATKPDAPSAKDERPISRVAAAFAKQPALQRYR